MNASDRSWHEPFSPDELAVYELYRRGSRRDPDWQASALLIVDATEAFFGPDLPTIEAARARRTACGRPAWSSIPYLQGLLEAFRRRTRPIAYSKPLWTQEGHVGGTTAGEVTVVGDDPIVAAIQPEPGDYVFEKSKPSAFFGTPLVSYLVRHRVSTVVIGGGATSGCVRGTAVDASSLGFDVVVVSDACFDRSMLSHNVALFELEVKYAAILPTATVVASIDAVA